LIGLGANLGVDMVIKKCIVEIVHTALHGKQGKMEAAATVRGSGSGDQSGTEVGLDRAAGRHDKEGAGTTRDKHLEEKQQARKRKYMQLHPRPARPRAPAQGAGSRRLSAGGAVAPSTAGGQPGVAGRKAITVQTKQSGVLGVCWFAVNNGWVTRWRENNVNKLRTFPVHRYMTPGKTHEEAEAEALCAAVAFREELVRQGKIKVTKACHQSNIRGVSWVTKNKAWKVEIRAKGKKFYGGSFHPKDDTPEALEQARLAAIESRRRLELEHFQVNLHQAPDPGQIVDRDSGVRGVYWKKHACSWRVEIQLKDKKVSRSFPPKDGSPAEVERARLAAVQCRRDLERQKAEQLVA